MQKNQGHLPIWVLLHSCMVNWSVLLISSYFNTIPGGQVGAGYSKICQLSLPWAWTELGKSSDHMATQARGGGGRERVVPWIIHCTLTWTLHV